MLGGLKNFWQAVADSFWRLLEPVLIVVLVTTIAWWVSATVIWPSKNTLHQKFFVQLESVCATCRMEIELPAIVLADSQAAQIHVTFFRTGFRSRPLTTLLTIPPGLTLSNSITDQLASRTVRLEFSGNAATETKSVTILNDNSIDSWRVIEKELPMQFISNSRVLPETQPSLHIGIEGTGRAALRRLGSREGDGTASLFPLATLLLSVAGLYYQELRQRQQRAERAAEQQQIQQRQKARDLLDEFRRSIREGKIPDAKDIFKKIGEENLTQLIEPIDFRIANRILTLIQGSVDTKDIDELSATWPAETASALIYVVDHNPDDRSALVQALRGFPINMISDANLHERLSQARERLGIDEPVQARETPRLEQQALPYLSSFGKTKNPFPEEKAENDVYYLFGGSERLFWPEHPVSRVTRLRGLSIVAGAPGSGKTAVALAMGRHLHHKDVLSCYFPGTPEFGEIRSGLALRLLESIEHYPSYLVLLGREERKLLAQVLCQDVGSATVIAKLDRMLIHSSKWGWLNTGKDDNQKRLWEREGVTHLRLLHEAVRSLNTAPMPDKHWASAIRSCATSMKFQGQIDIVIDADNTISNAWLERTYLPHQQSLQQVGINYIVFVPESKATNLGWTAESPPDGCRSYLNLVWDEPKLLEKWIRYRWRRANRENIEDLFANSDLLQALIRKSDHNPGRFIHLWNQIHQNKSSSGRITARMIKQA